MPVDFSGIQYLNLKIYLANKFRVQHDDPDFEDRYHDSLELFLRYWNGEGSAHGAVCMYFQQWYSHKMRSKYHHMLVSEHDVHPELLEQAFNPEYEQEKYCSEILDLLNNVLEQEPPRNRVVVVRTVQGYRPVETAELLGMTRQRVDQIYTRVLSKLISKL